LNIGVIGFRLVQSEKAGEYPSTRRAPLPHYRTAPPILKKVAKTTSSRRLKGLSTSALSRGHSDVYPRPPESDRTARALDRTDVLAPACVGNHCPLLRQCPLYPQKRTLVERVDMSALCQKRRESGHCGARLACPLSAKFRLKSRPSLRTPGAPKVLRCL